MLNLVRLAICGVSLVVAGQAVAGQACIQTRGRVTHVVARADEPADCCSGRLQCSQFLSTVTVARPARAERT